MESDNIDNKLEEKYLPIFIAMGLPSAEAQKTFYEVLEVIKCEAQKQGTANLPSNMGDILLGQEMNNESINTMLSKKRMEGVTDDDIRWWWNMDDLERRMMEKIAEAGQYATFAEALDKGMGEKEASNEVRRKHPMYGDTEDERHAVGNNKPLPPELINRITNYLQWMGQNNPIGLLDGLRNATSFNAFIRDEIAKGNL